MVQTAATTFFIRCFLIGDSLEANFYLCKTLCEKPVWKSPPRQPRQAPHFLTAVYSLVQNDAE
jgi:hypothetical protein